MQIKAINSLNQYLLLVEEVKLSHFSEEKRHQVKQDGELLFRGQADDYPLLPKIARSETFSDVTKREASMLHEFRRLGNIYKDLDNLDDWGLLTIAQHYGMATRLLDWTRNPLTALWFACKNRGIDKEAYVYILLPHWDISSLDRVVVSSPYEHTGISILRPNLEDSRVIAQDAWFTVHSMSRKYNKFIPLGDNEHHAEGMVKVVIQSGSQQSILKSLDILGISNQTIFPDLEGICAHINWVFASDD